MMPPPLRLVLICPPFFGYDQAIAETATAQGYCVTVLDARLGRGVFYKSALKLFPRLTRRLTQAPFRKRFADIDDPASVDHVLLVKGDGMTAETIASLRALMPKARLTVYLWDALRNMPGMGSGFKLADRVFTFDRQDSDEFGWNYLPLFARSAVSDPSPAVEVQSVWDWSFIGSLHSDRHRVLRAVVDAHPQHRYFVHCYVQNRLVKLFRALGDPGIVSWHPPLLSSQVMDYARYQEVVRNSRAVLDIEHPSQTGMTMRTIEALLDNKKLITTNTAVRDSELYHPSRVIIIDRAEPQIDQDFLHTPFVPVPQSIRKNYQIDNWLRTLLSWG